jgi:chorismate synthase
MYNNTLGDIFSVTSFGESHGPMVGCVIDGVPPGHKIDLTTIQTEVDMRKTAQTNFASERSEADLVQIVSGVYGDQTLGTPVAILIANADAKSADYDALQNVYRPSHADYTTMAKYGVRDHRGGGRSSIRITAPLVAAGEIARQLIVASYSSIEVRAWVNSIGAAVGNASIAHNLSQTEIYAKPFRVVDDTIVPQITTLVDNAKLEGDTLGGSITCIITNMKAGIGSPIFHKLQARLAQAMLSINTVKSFEFGSGAQASMLQGSMHNDAFVPAAEGISTVTNNSGGIQGGISNGMPIYFTIHFKPISSIKQAQSTVNTAGDALDISITGRHDVCAVPRAVAIVRAYTHIILYNELQAQHLVHS